MKLFHKIPFFLVNASLSWVLWWVNLLKGIDVDDNYEISDLENKYFEQANMMTDPSHTLDTLRLILQVSLMSIIQTIEVFLATLLTSLLSAGHQHEDPGVAQRLP